MHRYFFSEIYPAPLHALSYTTSLNTLLTMNKHELLSKWMICLRQMEDLLHAEGSQNSEAVLKNFRYVFSRVQLVSFEKNNVILGIDAPYFREYIEGYFMDVLSKTLQTQFGINVSLYYQLNETPPPVQPELQPGNAATQPRTQEVMPPNYAKKVVSPYVVPGIQKIKIESNLNRNYTFDSFVQGESNRFVSNIARVIAKRPGETSFNPLFIHGGVGTGKTHLLHAIGLEVKARFPEKVVLYLSSEKFISDFIQANKERKLPDFYSYYQSIDVLMMDDIQFLTGKKATQDSFFHVFDFLHQNGKQIILTSDKAPQDIMDIEERVVSRFKWGLTAEMNPPDFETRKAIFISKLSRDGIHLSEEIIDHLATTVEGSVRDIIGMVNSLLAQSLINKEELSLNMLKKTVTKVSYKKEKVISIAYIMEVICTYFGITQQQLISKSRKKEISIPRQLAMYLSKEYTSSTFSMIGSEIGGKNHSTVMYACKTIENISKVDKELNRQLGELRELIHD